MSNRIHPMAVVEGDVHMGDGNEIGPFCYLRGPLTLGNDNLLTSHVCLGAPGQETKNIRYDDSRGRVVVGSGSTFREFVSVQQPYHEAETRVGDGVFLMQSVHVPHDSHLEDGVVITPMTVLAGLTRVMRHANLGINSAVTQFVVVGPYSIVAAGSVARRHVRPFVRAIPGKADSVNYYAVRKFGFEHHLAEVEAYVLDGERPTEGDVLRLVERFEQECAGRDQQRGHISQ